jgi:uncharacterized protein YjbI with pentapeptide repeats
MAAVTIIITLKWLLPIAGRSPSVRIDAIKAGLSVGAGTGGAAALMLALRRQWLYERSQAHTEEVARITQAHAIEIAWRDAHDATQRRITDLYCRAVEQLGHANAAVRLGGLYSLERLAQEHSEHRQTVVDVICAYLRMPFQVPAGAGTALGLVARSSAITPAAEAIEQDTHGESRQEFQVRLAAQRMLARHLDGSIGPGKPAASFWDAVRIDLNGAVLVGLDFSGCRLDQADFRNAQFSREASFDGTYFTGTTRFDEAVFNGNARFSRARFEGNARFNEVQFERNAEFAEVHFIGNASFSDTQFTRAACFSEAKFKGNARFDEAQFSRDILFDKATFAGSTWFGGTQFNQGCTFEDARAIYGKCKNAWPDGWHLEPISDFTGKIIRDNAVFPGLAGQQDARGADAMTTE